MVGILTLHVSTHHTLHRREEKKQDFINMSIINKPYPTNLLAEFIPPTNVRYRYNWGKCRAPYYLKLKGFIYLSMICIVHSNNLCMYLPICLNPPI